MNIITIAAVAIVSAISAVAIKKHNGEISLMLSIACGVILLTAVISFAATILQTVNKIAAASDMNIEYIKILLKVRGICIVTELAVSVCKESGQQAIATNVTLAGKILIMVTSLPLYTEILNTVVSLVENS